MKRTFRLTTLLLTALLAMSLSSCLNDNNDTVQQVGKKDYEALSGNFTGTAKYIAKPSDKTLTTEEGVKIAVTPDSIMRITGISAAALAKNINDDDIRQAIAAQPSPVLTARFVIYSAASQGMSMFMKPLPVEFKGVTVKGEKHDYAIAFHSPSLASLSSSYNKLTVSIFMKTLMEDGKEKESFFNFDTEVNEKITIFIECNRDK